MIFKLSFVAVLLNLLNGVWTLDRFEQDHLQHDYNILKLSVNWSPIVSCEKILTNGSETTCSPCKSSKAVNKWTIHGLWPTSREGDKPFQCSNVPFDSDLIVGSEWEAEMKNKWPSLLGSDEDFWTHEWTKHGTCYLDLDGTNSLPKYFSKTLELYDRFNVGKILLNAGITPSEKYESGRIHRALRDSLGVKVFLACIRNQQSRQQFIQEIHICFDRKFELMDCADTNPYLDSCTDEYEVTYLESC